MTPKKWNALSIEEKLARGVRYEGENGLNFHVLPEQYMVDFPFKSQAACFWTSSDWYAWWYNADVLRWMQENQVHYLIKPEKCERSDDWQWRVRPYDEGGEYALGKWLAARGFLITGFSPWYHTEKLPEYGEHIHTDTYSFGEPASYMCGILGDLPLAEEKRLCNLSDDFLKTVFDTNVIHKKKKKKKKKK